MINWNKPLELVKPWNKHWYISRSIKLENPDKILYSITLRTKESHKDIRHYIVDKNGIIIGLYQDKMDLVRNLPEKKYQIVITREFTSKEAAEARLESLNKNAFWDYEIKEVVNND